MHLIGMHFISMYIMGVHLVGVHLVSMYHYNFSYNGPPGASASGPEQPYLGTLELNSRIFPPPFQDKRKPTSAARMTEVQQASPRDIRHPIVQELDSAVRDFNLDVFGGTHANKIM
jgi:hypothetical protein